MNKTKICGNKKSLILLSSTLLNFSLFFVICSCAPDNLSYKNNSKSLDSLNNQINNKTREINNLNATVSDLQAELDNKNKNKDEQKEIDKLLKKIASLNI